LYQEDPEDVIEYPVVSDYAILCFLHPQKKNADVQKTINEYIDKITDQHTNSLDVKLPIETKMSPQRHY